MVKKNRDPRWDEEFQFMLDEPPKSDRLHVEVISISSRMGLLHPKVHIAATIKITSSIKTLLQQIHPICSRLVFLNNHLGVFLAIRKLLDMWI